MIKRKLILIVSLILITSGVAFMGYPLLLRIQAGFQQARLEKEFAEYPPYIEVAEKEPETQPKPETPQEPSVPQWAELPPTHLEIPAIDLSVQLEAVSNMNVFRKLKQMPSYYPQSSMPGEVGNVLIAGHSGTGPAAYFQKLKLLKPGDKIILHAPGISYYYEVEEVFKVSPTAVEVLNPLDYAAITLTTCSPKNTRRIVRGRFLEYILNPGE
jgi:sortase A